jgi:NADH-quinone oxidoreductase subunit M
MGFVSEDLIVQGLLRAHPIAAALLLIVTAFNGITLFRAFKRSFLGAGAPHAVAYRDLEDLYPRERNVLVAIVLTLLIGGFVPVPFIALHQGVVEVLQKFAAASQPMIH